jgi:hypothetical protein
LQAVMKRSVKQFLWIHNMEAAGRELLAFDPEVIVAQEFMVFMVFGFFAIRSGNSSKGVTVDEKRSLIHSACER